METPFRTEKLESFRIIGDVIHTTNRKKAGQKDVPEHWMDAKAKQLPKRLMTMMNREPFGLFGISVYNVDVDDAKKFDHYIGVSSDMQPEGGLVTYEVPAATWAVFPCTVETIGKTEVMAISKWLPKAKLKPLNSGYITGKMKSQAPDIEYYGENGTVEVWIAIES